jgi:hypothetical protein
MDAKVRDDDGEFCMMRIYDPVCLRASCKKAGSISFFKNGTNNF